MRKVRLRSVLKWAGVAVGGLAAAALFAVGVTYVVMGRDLGRNFEPPATSLSLPVDGTSLDEGRRLARLRGCVDGCHGKESAGQVFFELPDGTSVVAPDLAEAARRYSPVEFDRIMRHGIKPDGTSVILAMPSNMFTQLSDADAGKIISFLRSQAPSGENFPKTHFGPLGRLLLLLFKQESDTILAAELIGRERKARNTNSVASMSQGEYLAKTTCTECHGTDLGGAPDGSTPSLAISAAYTLESFAKLMRSGAPLGDRKLGLMERVALSRFAHFTDDEISALHHYLKKLIEA